MNGRLAFQPIKVKFLISYLLSHDYCLLVRQIKVNSDVMKVMFSFCTCNHGFGFDPVAVPLFTFC